MEFGWSLQIVLSTSAIKQWLCLHRVQKNFQVLETKQQGRTFGVRERCERRRDKHVSEKDTERERQSEGTDSDRNCPGLSPGLLSGRVCASLSACLSSPLLSILLKTICLLIIHRLLFWTDMFSLHRYFHCGSNVPLFPSENGRAVCLPTRHTLRWNNIS